MARVHVSHGLGDLRSDLEVIPVNMVERGTAIVKKDIREGRDIARRSVRGNAPRHGVHYDDAITDETTGALEGEYGPDSSMMQGGMSFEQGSRNQPPHLDMAKSFDVIGPKFADDIGDMVEGLFWP